MPYTPDAAPAIYVNGQPSPNAAPVRQLERALGATKAEDPYAGGTVPLTRYLADESELRLLHMWTADPLRNPTLVQFANPDFYLSTGPTTCTPNDCVAIYPPEAWNHGDVDPQINRTWVGFVGPGVAHLGRNNDIWASHTDDNPTVMALLGLHDDYQPQGRVLEELHAAGSTRRSRGDRCAGTVRAARSPLLADPVAGRGIGPPFTPGGDTRGDGQQCRVSPHRYELAVDPPAPRCDSRTHARCA